MKSKITLAFFLLLSVAAQAQEKIAVTSADYSNSSVEMADLMRSDGKIYVLLGIVLLVFAGLTAYVIHTDRKVSKLEKLISDK